MNITCFLPQFFVKVIATDESENTKEVTSTFKTTSIPTPSLVVITTKDITTSEITINWTAATIEGSNGIAYDIYLDGTLADSDLNALTYSFTDLNAEQTYAIEVIAKSNIFDTASNQVIEATTLAEPTLTNFTIEINETTTSEITINWTAATIEGSNGIAYDIYLDGSLVDSDLDVLTYSFTDLNAGETYTIEVTAKSNEFGTTSTQIIEITTSNGPDPDDFTLTIENIGTGSARISWTSLTVGDDNRVFADIYINDNEEATSLTSIGYSLTGLAANTEYTIKVIARSFEYGTTLEKEITFTTEAFPTTFEVTSATVSPRTDGTFFEIDPTVIIRFSNRDLLDGIELNDTSYSYSFAGSDGINFSITDDEFDALNNATTKEGTANFTENGVSSSITFEYTIN